jgi:hypothetical protein
MQRQAFKLPKITISDLCDKYAVIEFNRMQAAQSLFAVYEMPEGGITCVHTGFGQNILNMLAQTFHRHIGIYQLTKLAFLTIEHLQIDETNSYNFNLSKIDYINLGTIPLAERIFYKQCFLCDYRPLERAILEIDKWE